MRDSNHILSSTKHVQNLVRIKTHIKPATHPQCKMMRQLSSTILHLDSSRPPRSLLWPPAVDSEAAIRYLYIGIPLQLFGATVFPKARVHQTMLSIERAIPCSIKKIWKITDQLQTLDLTKQRSEKVVKPSAHLNRGAQHCLAKPRGPTTKT